MWCFTHPSDPAGYAVDVVRLRALLRDQDFLNGFVSGPPQIDMYTVAPDFHCITWWPRVTSILLLSVYAAPRREILACRVKLIIIYVLCLNFIFYIYN